MNVLVSDVFGASDLAQSLNIQPRGFILGSLSSSAFTVSQDATVSSRRNSALTSGANIQSIVSGDIFSTTNTGGYIVHDVAITPDNLNSWSVSLSLLYKSILDTVTTATVKSPSSSLLAALRNYFNDDASKIQTDLQSYAASTSNPAVMSFVVSKLQNIEQLSGFVFNYYIQGGVMYFVIQGQMLESLTSMQELAFGASDSLDGALNNLGQNVKSAYSLSSTFTVPKISDATINNIAVSTGISLSVSLPLSTVLALNINEPKTVNIINLNLWNTASVDANFASSGAVLFTCAIMSFNYEISSQNPTPTILASTRKACINPATGIHSRFFIYL